MPVPYRRALSVSMIALAALAGLAGCGGSTARDPHASRQGTGIASVGSSPAAGGITTVPAASGADAAACQFAFNAILASADAGGQPTPAQEDEIAAIYDKASSEAGTEPNGPREALAKSAAAYRAHPTDINSITAVGGVEFKVASSCAPYYEPWQSLFNEMGAATN